jgi:hypothetical protein
MKHLKPPAVLKFRAIKSVYDVYGNAKSLVPLLLSTLLFRG